MKSRIQILTELLEFSRPLYDLKHSLGDFPWDVHEELVEMTIIQAGQVVSRFLADELSAADLEEWANAIEGREDIYFDPAVEGLLKEFLHEWRTRI
jgi:hypothetical protein